MSERVKFYLDEQVNLAIAAGLRRRDVDVLTTQEARMLDASDEAHLAMAAAQNRVIFTRKNYQEILAAFPHLTQDDLIKIKPLKLAVSYRFDCLC